MKVVFVSNFLSHHQIPLCESLQKKCSSFKFVATDSIGSQGYQIPHEADYVMHFDDDNQREEVISIVREADVAIFGNCPEQLISIRMKDNKLSFLYAERFFKRGTWRRFIPKTRRAIYRRIVAYKDNNMYVLCASAFLPYDLSLFGFPDKKCFKWGYFPDTKKYDIETLLDKKVNITTKILWVGRLLSWKHPDDAIRLAEKLRKNDITFEINLIGDGELKNNLEAMIKSKNLGDCVHLLGSKTTEEVRNYMEESSILLFTSDRKEGWGAVLNEAINGGCAVVASHAIGSVPFLIKDGENGLIYRDGDIKNLYEKVKYLIDNKEKTAELGKSAYITLTDLWNAEIAAERFIKLAENIQSGNKNNLFEDGPCSGAAVLKDNWR